MGSEGNIIQTTNGTDGIQTDGIQTDRIQADRRTVTNGLNKLSDHGVLAFALAITALASAFIGYKNGRIDLRFADAVSDNNFLQAPFIPGDINIQNNHTHLLKWPVMLLENWVGFDVTTHRVTSIVLLLAMNLWLGWLFYVFSKKNAFATAVCLLLLSSIEIMTGLSANEGTLTMLTNRNIEVPMTVAILMFALTQRKFLTLASVLVTLLLSIIFVSDRLYAVYDGIGAVFYAVYLAVTSRNYDVRRLDNRPLFLTVVVAAVASEAIMKLFGLFGIALFFARRDHALVFQGSFRDFFNYALDNVGRIFAVFGADYFGQKIYYGPFFLVNVIALALTVWLGVRFIKKVRGSGLADDRERVVFLLILMYFVAMLIFTVVIPRELGDRYFVFLPIIGLLLLAHALEDVQDSPTHLGHAGGACLGRPLRCLLCRPGLRRRPSLLPDEAGRLYRTVRRHEQGGRNSRRE